MIERIGVTRTRMFPYNNYLIFFLTLLSLSLMMWSKLAGLSGSLRQKPKN